MLINEEAELNGNEDLKYEIDNLYYAFCTKDPKKLQFSNLEPWSDIDENLKKIFYEKLKDVEASELNTKKFAGANNGQIFEVNTATVVPEGFAFPMNDSVINILNSILQDASENNVLKCANHLALKYLASNSSQTSVYALATFNIRDQQPNRKFIFITLCDLKKEKIDFAIDEINKKLISSVLKNAFSEKKLTKGIVYPYNDDGDIRDDQILFYDQQESTLYWTEAFECKERLGPAEERKAFNHILREGVNGINDSGADKLMWAGLTTGIQKLNKEISLGDLELILNESKIEYTSENLSREWALKCNNADYKLSKQNVFSDRSDYVVKIGNEIKISTKPNKLKDFTQFEHGGKIYLVIESDTIATLNDMAAPIKKISWNEFKQILE